MKTALSALLACAAVACGGDSETHTPRDGGVDSGLAMDAAALPTACTSAEAGTPCGEGQHCIAQRCVPNYCGDGVPSGTEQCDDGNQLLGDGCTPSCRSVPLTCGDGRLQDGEECDDANQYEYDDCSTACTINRCGNGVEDAFEECDDGNQVNDDDCSLTCKENRCGNGRVDVHEECDDGNQIHDDGTWLYEENGTRNNRDTCSNACVQIECGNGRIEGPLYGGSEQCDDGNDVNEDACANNCQKGGCGNGKLDPGEVCETVGCVLPNGRACPGHTATHRCKSDCSGLEATEDVACKECRLANCTDLEGYNAYGACLVSPPVPEPGAPPNYYGEKEEAIRRCSNLVTCMRSSGVGYDSTFGPIQSFCGTIPLGQCDGLNAGVPIANGPCPVEWAMATNVCEDAATCTPSAIGTGAVLLVNRASNITRIAGAAFSLISCDAAFCAQQCGPGTL